MSSTEERKQSNMQRVGLTSPHHTLQAYKKGNMWVFIVSENKRMGAFPPP
jgi:hypothetical protein